MTQPSSSVSGALRLPLPHPYDVPWVEWYLEAHTVAGLEQTVAGRYARPLALPSGPALLSLRFVDDAVELDLSAVPSADRPEALTVVRRLLDLDTDGAAVDARLTQDRALAASVSAAPGVRVPGTTDGWELLVRTMVGQQISLAAARTHLARLVVALGEPVQDPDGAAQGEPAWRLFPTAAAVADGGPSVLSGPRRRVSAVLTAAEAVARGRLDLTPGRAAGLLRADLLELPGVGPWTADYVVMRLAPDRDVLLAGDLVVRQGARLLGLEPGDLVQRDRWSPYRSYATMHLWRVALAARSAARGRDAPA